MTDKPNKSTKANQLEALNALIDKQTARLTEITSLMNNLKAMLDTVASIDKDKKCSCKDGGCSSCDNHDSVSKAQYQSDFSDLIKQWSDIQPGKSEKDCSERIAELEEKLKKEAAIHEQHIAELNKMHHFDLVHARKKYEELLNEAKRGCKCKCNDTKCEDDDIKEYDKVFIRFELESNNDVTIELSASMDDAGYAINCTIDYDDHNCSINMLTNELDKDVLETIFTKVMRVFDRVDIELTISDVTKIATKLHQLFAELS
jgi:hypothetical protein